MAHQLRTCHEHLFSCPNHQSFPPEKALGGKKKNAGNIVNLAGYIVNLSEFYSYRLIGKLTAFLHLQEFSLRRHNQVASSPSAVRLASRSYRAK